MFQDFYNTLKQPFWDITHTFKHTKFTFYWSSMMSSHSHTPLIKPHCVRGQNLCLMACCQFCELQLMQSGPDLDYSCHYMSVLHCSLFLHLSAWVISHKLCRSMIMQCNILMEIKRAKAYSSLYCTITYCKGDTGKSQSNSYNATSIWTLTSQLKIRAEYWHKFYSSIRFWFTS